MRIEICSQATALRLAAEATAGISIISITSKGEPDVVFADNPHIVSVLHLKCDDLSEKYDREGIPYGRPLPSQADLEGLKSFVDGLTCERLIVHCWEGRSRSAAVAKAVYEYLGSTGSLCANEGAVSPNPLVYALTRRELGR